jgi:hypothetical protein
LNNNLSNDNQYNMEFEEIKILNNEESDSESLYITQRPRGRQNQPDFFEIPNVPGGGPNFPNMPGGPSGGPNSPNMPGGPGFPNMPGGPGGGPNFPNMPGGPGGGRGPMMAPPNIAPQLPKGFAIPAPGSEEFNTQYRDMNRSNNIAFQFRRCVNHFTFIWFWNGRSFWFYPIFVGRNVTEGFIWRQRGWEYERINLNRIFFFRCF